MSAIEVKIVDPDLITKINSDSQLLRVLCQKEVDNFDKYLRGFGSEYSDGLAKFERLAIEGYLYQKLKGRLNVDNPGESGLPTWSENGKKGSD